MLWLIAIYLMLNIGVLIFSMWKNINEDEPDWYLWLEVLSDAAPVLFIVAYWFVPAMASLGLLWPLLLVFSVGWDIWTWPHESRKAGLDADANDPLNRPAVIFGLCFTVVFCAPAYIWGGILSWNYLEGVF